MFKSKWKKTLSDLENYILRIKTSFYLLTTMWTTFLSHKKKFKFVLSHFQTFDQGIVVSELGLRSHEVNTGVHYGNTGCGVFTSLVILSKKMSITKNMLLNWHSSTKKKERKIWMIFDIENWLWKSNFGTFWQLAINPKLKIQ